MKKYLLTILTILCVIICAFGATACIDPGADNGKDYIVTVLCGEGGTYSLSEPSPVPENIDETLTVMPDNDYEINEVTYNGAKIVLTNENTYTFNVTEDATITISFKKKDTDDPPATTTKYTVSVTCGENGGFTIMRDDNDEVISDGENCEVEENTSVTLNVIPDVGYRIVNVIIDGKPVQPDEGTDDEYTFVVTKDINIGIIFDEEVVEGKYGITSVWFGNRKTLDGSIEVDIDADNVSVTENGNTFEANGADSDANALTLKTDNGEYTFGWYEGIIPNKLMTYNGKILISTEKTKIVSDFDGQWYNYYGKGTMSIDASEGTVAIDGEDFYVADCGYIENIENNDESLTEIKHECYYLVKSDNLVYLLAWYRDDTTAGEEYGRKFDSPAIIGGEWQFQPFINEIYMDPLLDGKWRNFTTPAKIIEANSATKTITIDGQIAKIYNKGGTKGAGNIIEIGRNSYSITVDSTNPQCLILDTPENLGIVGRQYFLRSDVDPLKVTEQGLLDTEWENLLRTKALKIDAEGNVQFNYKQYYIFAAEMLDNGFYRIVAYAADNSVLNVTYDSKKPTSIDVSEGYTVDTYYKKLSGDVKIEAGFLGLAKGKYYDVYGYIVEIFDDKMTIDVSVTYSDYDENTGVRTPEPPIEVTEEILTPQTKQIYGSSSHYTFRWRDTLGVNKEYHTCHIAIDVTYTDKTGDAGSVPYKLMFSIGDYEEHFFNLPEVPNDDDQGGEQTAKLEAITDEKSRKSTIIK